MGRPIMIILSIVFGMALLSILYLAFSGPINTMGSTVMNKSEDIIKKININIGGQQPNHHNPESQNTLQGIIYYVTENDDDTTNTLGTAIVHYRPRSKSDQSLQDSPDFDKYYDIDSNNFYGPKASYLKSHHYRIKMTSEHNMDEIQPGDDNDVAIPCEIHPW